MALSQLAFCGVLGLSAALPHSLDPLGLLTLSMDLDRVVVASQTPADVRGSGFPPHGWLGWRWWGHNSGEGEGLCSSLGSAPGLSGTRSLLWLPKCDLVYKILHFAKLSFALEFSWAMN